MLRGFDFAQKFCQCLFRQIRKMITPAQTTAAPRTKKRGHRLENPPDCSAGADGPDSSRSSGKLLSGSLTLASEEGSSETALLSSGMEDSSDWEESVGSEAGFETGWLLVTEEALGWLLGVVGVWEEVLLLLKSRLLSG